MNSYSYVGGDFVKTQECDVCQELCEHPQNVCLAKAEMLADDDVNQLAETFKILGDTTRIRILHALSKRELCVCDLAAVVQMGQSAVSHQLRLLRGTRLVKYRKEGKMVWYSLDDDHIKLLLSQGIEHIAHR
jgi:DNA-binding transcriptional ArsR family regulator